MASVLRKWVIDLPLVMQGTLLTCVRGPDGTPKESAAKEMAKAYRFTIMHPGKVGPGGIEAGPMAGDSFMGDWTGRAPDAIEEFLRDHDGYPHHWLMHFMHCAEIVGYCHPDGGTAAWWSMVYNQFCLAFHVNPETRDQMVIRLRYDGDDGGDHLSDLNAGGGDDAPDALER